MFAPSEGQSGPLKFKPHYYLYALVIYFLYSVSLGPCPTLRLLHCESLSRCNVGTQARSLTRPRTHREKNAGMNASKCDEN